MIGIFGGTFDPVHHGHLRVALDVKEAIGLQQVRLIPLAQAVHRQQPLASAEQRWAMLQLALEGHPELIADPCELQRGGPSYMLDTLRALKQAQPQTALCLMVGGDAFNHFLAWRGPTEILKLANILVMQRPGHDLPADSDLRRLLDQHAIPDPTRFAASQAGHIHIHPVTQLAISSSDIRARIAAGLDPSFLLPDPVIDMIRQQQLYRC